MRMLNEGESVISHKWLLIGRRANMSEITFLQVMLLITVDAMK